MKDALVDAGAWSQYLEVGIGPDAEIFTKAQPMSAVGLGAEIGIHPKSEWNNPEPEIVLAVNSRGETVGATLGNDVNLRDFEGRSALLLGKAKDNNASCAIGPFIRLFDETSASTTCAAASSRCASTVARASRSTGASSMSHDQPRPARSRRARDRRQPPVSGRAGAVPRHDVRADQGPLRAGQGFTHAVGDIVTIATPKLGALVNRVNHSDKIRPWTFGAGALMQQSRTARPPLTRSFNCRVAEKNGVLANARRPRKR